MSQSSSTASSVTVNVAAAHWFSHFWPRHFRRELSEPFDLMQREECTVTRKWFLVTAADRAARVNLAVRAGPSPNACRRRF